ncbi:sugar phosphate isomerase/epimerase family protein [Paenibacillus piri]|uniref:Sugar phosphate isomerase/epimerase n=1 Tax=Paenibacillus piri TaxID=2547395 RepID=A0A4R5KF93_9BACL|nr:TIM barrel protein [Paenibacillus piri]TDF92927.1 sugar phosphate isomerase/epimerase [Paenibacillus piri]
MPNKWHGQTIRVGLGSYAFRYAVGFSGFQPPQPMKLNDFLAAAAELGYEGVQLCENLRYSGHPRDSLLAAAEQARELGLFVELGMRDLGGETLRRHLEIAEVFGSRLIRLVLGAESAFPEKQPQRMKESAVKILTNALGELRDLDVIVGLENHFDLASDDLLSIVEEVGDSRVGLILDTTNGLGFLEKPEVTLAKFIPHLVSIHLKDYQIRKVEAGYFVTGTALGEGLLDVKGILRNVLGTRRPLSIIVELTTRRTDDLTDILAWEADMNYRSMNSLRQMIREMEA